MFNNKYRSHNPPFLRWAGGKRWLTKHYHELLPKKFKNYHEPFLGSAAVFYHLQPDRTSYLSDVNPNMIITYNQMKDNSEELYEKLKAHEKNHCEAYYYEVRASMPEKKINIAAKFIYLNRTCFNGIYRENNSGSFNVPIGKRKGVITPVFIGNESFDQYSKTLQKANISQQSYHQALLNVQPGDFCYCDPPYVQPNAKDKFTKYNKKLFTWDDQITLSKMCRDIVEKGARVMVSNIDCREIRELYNHKYFNLIPLKRRSSIAASETFRKNYNELLILSL